MADGRILIDHNLVIESLSLPLSNGDDTYYSFDLAAELPDDLADLLRTRTPIGALLHLDTALLQGLSASDVEDYLSGLIWRSAQQISS